MKYPGFFWRKHDCCVWYGHAHASRREMDAAKADLLACFFQKKTETHAQESKKRKTNHGEVKKGFQKKMTQKVLACQPDSTVHQHRSYDCVLKDALSVAQRTDRTRRNVDERNHANPD